VKHFGKWWTILIGAALVALFVLGLCGGCSSEAPYMVETRDSDPNSMRLVMRSWTGDDVGVEVRVIYLKGHWIVVALRGDSQVAICELTEASKEEQ